MRDYRNIQAWQRADDMTVAVYEYTLDRQQHDSLMDAVQSTFRPLYGLIKTVEKEANPLQRVAARVTSWVILLWAGSLSSVVRSP